jgi:hypothetical protein
MKSSNEWGIAIQTHLHAAERALCIISAEKQIPDPFRSRNDEPDVGCLNGRQSVAV